MTNQAAFQSVLSKYRSLAFSQRDKGDRFERLMQSYLRTTPLYANKFSNVWLWNEFPSKDSFGGKDTGIDIVAKTVEGEFWAVQCKCFAESAVIDKPHVDTFLSTSGRKFSDDDGNKVGFSHRLFISTTNHWGANAEESIKDQHPSVNRINLTDLELAPVDWKKLDRGVSGSDARRKQKTLFPHQVKALEQAHDHYKTADRGKLIMACGTGKTFTSLRIAENETNGKGLVLFLVPSIALLGQSLVEWFAESVEPINAICVCSDSTISKKRSSNDDSDSMSVVDLALPASTNVKEVVQQIKSARSRKHSGMTVIFSTYQSLDVISKAQTTILKDDPNSKNGVFDLVICDEAHRTTGVTLASEDSSSFVKIHDNKVIRAKKRLYMTATPRLYSDDSKAKAAKAEAVLCSMDDESLYGEEFYRIGFGEAVEKDLLSDYKVLILTISESDMPAAVQNMVADSNNEINSDDASKLIGCINALSKKIIGDDGVLKNTDPEPMRRAVAFCQNIKISKKISAAFDVTRKLYYDSIDTDAREGLVNVDADHIDGTMSAPYRDEKMSWLKGSSEEANDCRILTNVRCLSEGVDVPSLDAVLFLSARNSQVDVVQSVGRVMRKSPGKKYGYIIIPVVVPANVEADKALNNNERYKVVWTVLNALRAHDDRFNAIVNKIELNHKKPEQILIGRIDNGTGVHEPNESYNAAASDINSQLSMQFEQLQSVLFARMVQKVGDRRYWEQWAKDVAQIAERQIERIERLVREDTKHKNAFERFLRGLQKNINPSITEHEAIEMLGQHLITKPVFEALFEGYSFVKNNAISVSMQKMLDLLSGQSLEKDTETLQRFYESVKSRASGIDNAAGKQKIIVELYDKFFKTAFPKMVEKLGIVYTPVEVVDFIIHSVEVVLNREFSRSISNENVHVLDPFTGTGTFMTRLLQSGLIQKIDLKRKYEHELHANEIVLLAYYIAAINIENAYHDYVESQNIFVSFDGICLTDTFQLGETDDRDILFSDMFPQNSKRVQAQQRAPLRVIMGNPPYSKGQKSANDNAQNQSYPKLESRIAHTYAAHSSATNKNALYNPYIKAIRWSSDRLDKSAGGIIAFVTDGGWIDNGSMNGFRKCLENEFTSIYVFNLRGDQRTSGELSRKEGGKIFGSGSRSPIVISLLVLNPNSSNNKANIYYHDIGEYLSREDKLLRLNNYVDIESSEVEWLTLTPDSHGDWLTHRTDLFASFIPLAPDKKFDAKSHSVFVVNSLGVQSSRDPWVYNYSELELIRNAKKTVNFYNNQVHSFIKAKQIDDRLQAKDFIDKDPTKISWSSSLIPNVDRGNIAVFDENNVVKAAYRPFCKQHLYLGDKLIHRRGQFKDIFPESTLFNRVICVSGVSGNKVNSSIMTDSVTDLNILDASTQCFPLYYYEKNDTNKNNLFSDEIQSQHVRRDGVSDFILSQASTKYCADITKEDIFYYTYGLLHSSDYRYRFAADLNKVFPRIPLVSTAADFWSFSKSGRHLADLHINYENLATLTSVIVNGAESNFFRVERIRFADKADKTRIIFNSQISIEMIPIEAYEYVVNGKSAIEWIMESYQFTIDQASGIKSDPNEWVPQNPRYILDLLLSVIRLSVETVEIVKGLPRLKFDN